MGLGGVLGIIVLMKVFIPEVIFSGAMTTTIMAYQTAGLCLEESMALCVTNKVF